MKAPVRKNLSIDHVHYRCSSFDKVQKFYVEIMEGVELPSEILGKKENMHIQLGGVTLLFKEAKDETPMSSNILGAYHIAFLVQNCDDATDYYVSNGAKVAIDPTDYSPTIRASFLEAPDGMMVELKQIIPST